MSAGDSHVIPAHALRPAAAYPGVGGDGEPTYMPPSTLEREGAVPTKPGESNDGMEEGGGSGRRGGGSGIGGGVGGSGGLLPMSLASATAPGRGSEEGSGSERGRPVPVWMNLSEYSVLGGSSSPSSMRIGSSAAAGGAPAATAAASGTAVAAAQTTAAAVGGGGGAAATAAVAAAAGAAAGACGAAAARLPPPARASPSAPSSGGSWTARNPLPGAHHNEEHCGSSGSGGSRVRAASGSISHADDTSGLGETVHSVKHWLSDTAPRSSGGLRSPPSSIPHPARLTPALGSMPSSAHSTQNDAKAARTPRNQDPSKSSKTFRTPQNIPLSSSEDSESAQPQRMQPRMHEAHASVPQSNDEEPSPPTSGSRSGLSDQEQVRKLFKEIEANKATRKPPGWVSEPPTFTPTSQHEEDMTRRQPGSEISIPSSVDATMPGPQHWKEASQAKSKSPSRFRDLSAYAAETSFQTSGTENQLNEPKANVRTLALQQPGVGIPVSGLQALPVPPPISEGIGGGMVPLPAPRLRVPEASYIHPNHRSARPFGVTAARPGSGSVKGLVQQKERTAEVSSSAVSAPVKGGLESTGNADANVSGRASGAGVEGSSVAAVARDNLSTSAKRESVACSGAAAITASGAASIARGSAARAAAAKAAAAALPHARSAAAAAVIPVIPEAPAAEGPVASGAAADAIAPTVATAAAAAAASAAAAPAAAAAAAAAAGSAAVAAAPVTSTGTPSPSATATATVTSAASGTQHAMSSIGRQSGRHSSGRYSAYSTRTSSSARSEKESAFQTAL